MLELPGIETLFRLADAADAETLPLFRTFVGVDSKLEGGFDPVTAADKAAERAIRAIIEAEFPSHAILGEEYGSRDGGSCQWVIDPIDGTRSFVAGIPLWATLIGLSVDGRARMGIMSQPFTGERFWADGSTAQMRRAGEQTRLSVRDTRDLRQATLFTTSPHLFGADMRDRFAALEREVRMARYGTDCYAFAMLAAGHVDLVVEAGLKPYDIVALIPIIEQAGGIISTFSGDRAEAGGDVVAAASPRLHERALELLGRA